MADEDLDDAALDKLGAMRGLRRHLECFPSGRIQVLKLEPGTMKGDLAETIRDYVADTTATLNRHGRG